MVNKDEEARRINLRSLLRQDENAALKDQLIQKDCRIGDLSNQCDDIRSLLEVETRKNFLQEKKLRAQAREISDLKVVSFCRCLSVRHI